MGWAEQLAMEAALFTDAQLDMPCCMRCSLSPSRACLSFHACVALACAAHAAQTLPPHEAARLARIQARAGEVQVPTVFGYK